MRTYDLLQIAEAVAHLMPQLFSLEMWGGATFDTAMRFMQEDPWDRLDLLRTRIPNIPFQMLLRASNARGVYELSGQRRARISSKPAAEHGIDVFRIFDSLNWVENMKVAIEAVRENTNAICEAAICYTGDILDPKRTKYSLNYYVKLAKELVSMGTHVLGIKDMAGLCKPYAAHALVKALRDEVGVPIHFHTHDTSGINAASILRAADAGVDIADAALAAMSGTTSQPNLNSLVAALQTHAAGFGAGSGGAQPAQRLLGGRCASITIRLRKQMKAATAEVYHHEMPGGQYTNLRQQAKSLGLADRWTEIADTYAQVNQLFGDIVKVTPSSKVVGDLALFMVTNNLSAVDVLSPEKKLNFPRSVVEMMQGMLGFPEGGWPKVFQKIVLDTAGVKPIKGRPGAKMPKVDFGAAQEGTG